MSYLCTLLGHDDVHLFEGTPVAVVECGACGQQAPEWAQPKSRPALIEFEDAWLKAFERFQAAINGVVAAVYEAAPAFFEALSTGGRDR